MRALVLVSTLALVGCATLGAQALPEVQASYNERLALTSDSQFLLNVVRLRYRDTPAFLDVASLTTQQTNASTLSVTGGSGNLLMPAPTASGTMSGTVSVTPTTTFLPVRGDDFVKRLVAPVSLQTVTMVASSGWSIARVLHLTVDRINSLSNAPSATGPTPASPPDTERFIDLLRALRSLQLDEDLSLGIVRSDGADTGLMFLDDNARNPEAVTIVRDLLSLPRDESRFRLTEDFTRKEIGVLRVRLRSILGAMFYLSQGVEVPVEHEKAGLVTVTRDDDGRRFDWNRVLDGMFRVKTSPDEPGGAAVKAFHRGNWFYIADDDLESKSTFMLLIQIFNMQAGRASLPVPLLTIPAGR
ncbi:MAG: hypothetical protein INH41_22840 [Myxococcaceae bacterium]|jgi:hypothetical protein|nr:hypothetical protein [Myxococcaceae bacterium]MCA3015236.1 hypothetical protein [Myxococcaceae bacterium]